MKKMVTARLLPLLMAAVLLAGICPVPAAAAQSAASDVTQLTMTEGTVRVVNSYGRELTVNDGMRLYNGTCVRTAAASYAWLALDSAKAVKLDASSAVQLRRSGLRQEVLLESGALFFNIAEPPVEQQTLCLRTADVAAFVDNACGFVEKVDRWNTLITVLDGEVAYTAADPVTGQRLSGTAAAGETVMLTTWPLDHEGDKCTAETQQLLFYEIDGYVLEELAQDMDVCGRIYVGLNVDVLPPLGLLGSVAQMLDEVMMRPAQVRGQLQEEGGTEEVIQSLSQLQEQLEQIWKLLDEAGLSSQTANQGLQQVQALQQAARQAADDGDLLSAVEQLEDSRQALEQVVQYAGAAAENESVDMARQRIVQDQAVTRGLQAVIDEQLQKQDEKPSQDPVWKEPEPTATPAPTESPASGAGAGGGSYTPPPTPVPTPTVLRMGEFTLAELQQAITNSPGGVIVLPNEDPDENTLTIGPGETLAVPSIRSLTFQSTPENPIHIVVEGDSKNFGVLSVSGPLSIPGGDVTNGGIMDVSGQLEAAEVTNTNRLTISGTLDTDEVTNTGTLTVYGQVTGQITQNAGKLSIGGLQNNEPSSPDIGGGVLLHGGIFTMDSGRIRHGVEQTRQTGDEEDCTATVNGGVITGGYYYHYEFDEEIAKKMVEADPSAKDKVKFNLSIKGSTIQYVKDEAPEGMEPQAALVMKNNDFATNATVAVSGGTIDGGEGPAIAAGGTWALNPTVSDDVTVKGGVPDLVDSKIENAPYLRVYGEDITADSCLVTEKQEDGSYVLTDITTFADMLEEAKSGQTVTLDKDRALEGVTVPDGVTLDLNGHTLDLGGNTITLKGQLTVKGKGTISADGAVFKLNKTYSAEQNWGDVLTIAESVTIKSKTTDMVVGSDDVAVANPSGYTVSEKGADDYYTLTKDSAAGIALTSLEDEQQPEDGEDAQDPDASESPEPDEDADGTDEDTPVDDTEEPEDGESKEDETAPDDTKPSPEEEPSPDTEESKEPSPTPGATEEPAPANSENSEEVDA